ncbi:MAG: hypothetical protein R3D05_19560 [Dongiaceae bacterium]
MSIGSDAIAALTLVRALTHHLVETGRLTADDVEKTRLEALAELETVKGPIIEEARKLVEQEYP